MIAVKIGHSLVQNRPLTGNHLLAVALASIPEKIRGFGHVKARHLKSAKVEEGALAWAAQQTIAG